MLRWRLVGSCAILLPLLFLLWLDVAHHGGVHGAWLYPLGLLLAGTASSEIVMLRTGKGWSSPVFITVVAALVATTFTFVPVVYHPEHCPIGRWGWTVLGMFAAMVVLFLHEMWKSYLEGEASLLPLKGFAVCYVVIPVSFLLHLRLLHMNAWGIAAIASIVAITKLSDAGAYFVGRSIGRRPLAPRLSPNKTIEGAIGGIVVAALVAIGFHLHLLPRMLEGAMAVSSGTVWKLAVYGIVVALAGIFGDLAESYLKRMHHQKDSASWLPGLGGSLDIVDSVLWAAPVGYLWWATGLIGPTG